VGCISAMANEFARDLRKNRTTAERELSSRLRELKHMGFKFRQQAPIDRIIVDFVCFAHRLIIEVDGATHGTDEEQSRDGGRQEYLERRGFRVVRFSNDDVFSNLDGVMDTIVNELATPTPTPPRKGEGLSVR
jgi:very-short-patch-repair endonuclease